jgi:YggT family protein
VNRRPPSDRGSGYDYQDRGDVQPDDRTRIVPRAEYERVDEVIVENPPPVYTSIRHETSSSVVAARKAQQIVWYFFGIVETLLALRFILLAVGANRANPFFNFVTNLTNPFVAPFANLVETPRLGSSILELGTIFAMIIYLLVAYALARLLEITLTRGEP